MGPGPPRKVESGREEGDFRERSTHRRKSPRGSPTSGAPPFQENGDRELSPLSSETDVVPIVSHENERLDPIALGGAGRMRAPAPPLAEPGRLPFLRRPPPGSDRRFRAGAPPLESGGHRSPLPAPPRRRYGSQGRPGHRDLPSGSDPRKAQRASPGAGSLGSRGRVDGTEVNGPGIPRSSRLDPGASRRRPAGAASAEGFGGRASFRKLLQRLPDRPH